MSAFSHQTLSLRLSETWSLGTISRFPVEIIQLECFETGKVGGHGGSKVKQHAESQDGLHRQVETVMVMFSLDSDGLTLFLRLLVIQRETGWRGTWPFRIHNADSEKQWNIWLTQPDQLNRHVL